MSSRFSKLTSLHILEMFTSAFNSQETIVFLQSFAPKCLGSFIGTVAMANEPWNSRVTFTPGISLLPWFLVQLQKHVRTRTSAWRPRPEHNLSYYMFPSSIMPQRSYDQSSKGHTGLSSRTWNMSQAFYRLERCCVCFTFYVKSLIPRKDAPWEFPESYSTSPWDTKRYKTFDNQFLRVVFDSFYHSL